MKTLPTPSDSWRFPLAYLCEKNYPSIEQQNLNPLKYRTGNRLVIVAPSFHLIFTSVLLILFYCVIVTSH